jgi:hypothetical protein
MTDKTKKESPESSPQAEPTADDSGAFSIDPKSMTPATVALLPLLKASVSHQRKSNTFVKTTNQELIKMNAGQSTQGRWNRINSLLITLLILGAGGAWWLNHQDTKESIAALIATNERLDKMVKSGEDTAKAAEETKKAVEEKPTITVKTDTSGVPTSVVLEPPAPKKRPTPKPKKGDPPPPPAHNGKKPPGLEFPLGPPRKKK